MENMELYFGDCLIEMKKIEDKSVDLILCDLPYAKTQAEWDKAIDLDLLWAEYKRIIKDNGAILLFGEEPFSSKLRISNLEMFRYDWVWEKTTAVGFLNAKKMPMKAHEIISVFYKHLPTYNPQKTTGHKPVNNYTKHTSDGTLYGKTKTGISGGGSTERYPRSVIKVKSKKTYAKSLLTYKTDKQKESLHPTQKPLALLEYLIKTYTNEGDVVLDNCMGSGSTGVACIKTNRIFIGIEKNEYFFNIAKERIVNL